MTRFARAKGSKASNERTPGDSTPWEVMKEQLLNSKKENEEARKREDAEKQRIENYENFLKEHKVQKRKATWCDFPETVNIQNNNSQNGESTSKKKKKNKQKSDNAIKQSDILKGEIKENNSVGNNQNADDSKLKKKKNKNKQNTIVTQSTENKDEMQDVNEPSENPVNKVSLPKNKVQKKNKKNKQKKSIKGSVVDDKAIENTEQDETNTEKSSENVNLKQNDQNQPNHQKKKDKKRKNKKEKNLDNGQPVRRKPLTDYSFQLIINGKEVELVRFDGFPIMKKDAERLEELKTSMVKKGIPKSEVQRTIKLERRRAEKALARLKRDVCYNCRKGGHNLSDCPELKSKIPGVDAAEGVCFKCGSTEHRQFECKVQRDKEFRFATCFICKEAGHIARQCPDNPKGLYPNGGCCKLCGDVTHMRKDCPTVNEKKEETSIKLHTLNSAENIEGIDQTFKTTTEEKNKKPKKIKF